MESEQPPSPPTPWGWTEPAASGPPSDGLPRGELFDNRSPANLTLGNAISTGFRVLTKPTFIVPVLVLGTIVITIVQAIFGPLITQFSAGGGLGDAEVSARIGSLIGGFAVALIGGIVISVYGQVWVNAATSGPIPTFGEVLSLSMRRALGIIGSGFVVMLLLLLGFVGFALVRGVAGDLLGGAGVIAFVAFVVAMIWLSLRLSLAVWLAADGISISESISGSWAMTKGNLLRIIGWTIGFGLVFAITIAIAEIVLDQLPTIGIALGQSLQIALGYGAGVALYRRTQAAARGVDATFE